MTRSLLVLTLLLGCNDDDQNTCDPNMPTAKCTDGKVCEVVVGGMPTCSAPVVVRGHVKSTSDVAIAEAIVAALDANDAPASGAARTDAMGAYELRVPVDRQSTGAPAQKQIKLRAAAAGFETFPSGIRRSLPLELSGAVLMDGKYVLMSPATEIKLPPVANAAGLGSIAGTVQNGSGKSGALVVAEGGGVVATATSDIDGVYEIFNLAPGMYNVQAYQAKAQYTPVMATVTAGMRTANVNLVPNSKALNTVSGSVDIVNPMGGVGTSVVLVVESTFNEMRKRGEVPPGLRAPQTGPPNLKGSFMIPDVPDGKYVALAAFENDGLVRDPDLSIGGTQIVHLTIPGTPMPLTQFKITGALAVISPGANDIPDVATSPVTFKWQDDSSEGKYTLDVFDSHGNQIWGPIDVPEVSGSATVTRAYAGPALVSGQYYQFRATSWKKDLVSPISQTEDLRGVFIAP